MTKDTPIKSQDVKEDVLKLWCKIIWQKGQTLILKIPDRQKQINVIRHEVMQLNLNGTPTQQKLKPPVTTPYKRLRIDSLLEM